MIQTFNEKHYPELFTAARTKATELGEFVRTQGWVAADITIQRAAVGYVNCLPLNNIRLEKELLSAFVVAAEIAATQESEGELEQADFEHEMEDAEDGV